MVQEDKKKSRKIRTTISFNDEIAEALDTLKKEKYYNVSYSNMIRDLIAIALTQDEVKKCL